MRAPPQNDDKPYSDSDLQERGLRNRKHNYRKTKISNERLHQSHKNKGIIPSLRFSRRRRRRRHRDVWKCSDDVRLNGNGQILNP